MQEEIYVGEFVLVKYLTEEGERVYGGKLEKISLEGEEYKILFSEFYDDDLIDGKYRLIKSKLPALVSIPIGTYKGISLEPKKKLEKFYKQVNAHMNKMMKNGSKPERNFYSHGTKMGFRKDSD